MLKNQKPFLQSLSVLTVHPVGPVTPVLTADIQTVCTVVQWSKQRLDQLLFGLSADIPNERGTLTFTGTKQISGEVSDK